MKVNKLGLLLILLLPLSAFSQGMPGIICSGGAIACVIPGATATGAGTSQVVALPGDLTLGNGHIASPAGVNLNLNTAVGNTVRIGSLGDSTVIVVSNGGDRWKFGQSTDGYALLPSLDGTTNIGSLTQRVLGVYGTGYHSGATAMTFSTSSGDAVALTLGTDKSATLTGTITAASLLTSTGLSTTYLCVDTAGKFINDAAACIISAAKFKENVTSLDSKDALALVLGMRPVNYDLKDHAFDGWKNQFGFIADEAAKLRPELATYDEEGNVHGFRYEQYTAYLTGAIQQLNARIESLEKK